MSRGMSSNDATLPLTAEHCLKKSLEEDQLVKRAVQEAGSAWELMVATELKQEEQNEGQSWDEAVLGQAVVMVVDENVDEE